MIDGCTPRWDKRKILREAMESARRQSDVMWFIPRAVAISKIEYDVIDEHGYGRGPCNRWSIDVYGHELEVPDHMKHWTERLQERVDMLTSGDGWTNDND